MYKSVKISSVEYFDLKEYAIIRGLKLSWLLSKAVREFLTKRTDWDKLSKSKQIKLKNKAKALV
jgi:hypothetical protein